MGRKLRTTVPIIRKQLVPHLPDPALVRQRDEKEKQRQEKSFNKQHRVQELPELDPGDIVWVPDRNAEATVMEQTDNRSYEVQTDEGSYRRNIFELQRQEPSEQTATGTEPSENNDTTSRRSERSTHPPDRHDPSWT